MPCTHIKLDTGFAIACSRGRRGKTHICAHCPKPSEFQCDWKTKRASGNGRARTCDEFLCADHATEVAPDKHLCPYHKVNYERWLERKKVVVHG